MRLINVSTFELEEFHGEGIPTYAILSHTWADGEISFVDFETPEARDYVSDEPGYKKIRRFCRRARKDGYKYVWVDTVCIDKRSSSELTEAINSMFEWYRGADVCYAYLSDMSKLTVKAQIPKSQWFTRGWTLQELLAPRNLIFIDRDFNGSYTRESAAFLVSKATGIDEWLLKTKNARDDDLRVRKIRRQSVAKRMSWAAHRITTRVEDRAYSLLGIFDLSMPLLYGEGERAFQRLQEEIIRTSDDHSIFAWSLRAPRNDSNADANSDSNSDSDSDSGADSYFKENLVDGDYLAPSPLNFANSGDIVTIEPHPWRIDSTVITNRGLQIHLAMLPARRRVNVESNYKLALLNCRRSSDGSYVGMILNMAIAIGGIDPSSESLCRRSFVKPGQRIVVASVIVGLDLIWEARYARLRIERAFSSRSNFNYGNRNPIRWTLCGKCPRFMVPLKEERQEFELARVEALRAGGIFGECPGFSVMYSGDVNPVRLKGYAYNLRLQAKDYREPEAVLVVLSDPKLRKVIEVVLAEPFRSSQTTVYTRGVSSSSQGSTDGWLNTIRPSTVIVDGESLPEGSTVPLRLWQGPDGDGPSLDIKLSRHLILDQKCLDLEMKLSGNRHA